MGKKVLVLGGYGACGSEISHALVRDDAVECVIGGRDVARGEALAAKIGATFTAVDITRSASLNAALEGVFAVVNTCGPFHWHEYAVAERCARRGVHYVDLASDRSYIMGITKLAAHATESGAAVVSGGGSLLALSSVLAEEIRRPFDVIDQIEIGVSLGRGPARGPAYMRSLLYGQKASIQIREAGHWREIPGWSQGRTVRFPSLGRRRLYMTDAPELALFPNRYGAQVIYRAGLESAVVNRVLAGLGSLSRAGVVSDLPGRAPLVYAFYRLLRGFGHAGFGLSVVVSGSQNGADLRRSAGLVAQNEKLSMSCVPALALLRKWVSGEANPGAGPCMGLLSLADMTRELQSSQAVLVLS